jgi:transposase
MEAVDQVYPCRPPTVCACGGEVRVAEQPCVRHQVFELPPIRPIVTEYQCYAGVCTCCGQRVVGELPTGVPRGQFGPGVVSLIGLLAGNYHLSVRQIQRLFHDVFHLDIGLGTVSYGQAQVSAAVAAVVETARQAVQQAAVVNADETSPRQGTVRQWLGVAVSHPLRVFRIAAQRSQAAAQTLLGPPFAGVVVSDRYSAYHGVDPSHRQLGWAQLLRDFQRIAERTGRAGEIGQELLTYGHWLFTIWHRYREGQLPAEVFKALMGELRKLVELTLAEGARCDHPATAHTCQNLLDLKVALWTFVDTPGVEPTNDTAEQELRAHVIWRKLSFGTQSERGNRLIERIRTVTATCRRQGRAGWGYWREAVEAFFFGRPPLRW